MRLAATRVDPGTATPEGAAYPAPGGSPLTDSTCRHRIDARGFSIMARNVVNQPHRTPNPDPPHPAPIGAGARRGSPDPDDLALVPMDETAPEEPSYESGFDDLNVILWQSIEQPDPDPNLESPPTSGPDRAEPAPACSKSKKPPRTSEIFRSVGPLVAGTGPEALASVVGDPESAADSKPAEDPHAAATGAAPLIADRERPVPDVVVEEDDSLVEPRIPLSRVLLLSYSSAITLALVWILWTGRGSRSTEPRGGESPAPEAPPRSAERDQAVPPPPIPPENLVTLGQPVHLGDLEVTPLAVVAIPLELIRSIDPPQYRREEVESLVLRLRLTNVSKRSSFIPLDAYLVRERGLRPYDPFIATSEGPDLRFYPLAIESEWSIAGQDFPKLDPGETAETIVAAEPGSTDRLAGEMTWRVRLRTGVYRSDMLGVRFHKNQVRHVLTLDEPARDEAR